LERTCIRIKSKQMDTIVVLVSSKKRAGVTDVKNVKKGANN